MENTPRTAATPFTKKCLAFLARNSRILAGAVVLPLILFWAYRAELLSLFHSIYPSTMKMDLGGLISRSLGQDLLALLLVFVFIIPILFLAQRHYRTRYLLFALIMELAAVFLFIGLGHFQIFEIPLDLGMLGMGLGTFWQEIVNSATYEITPRLYTFLLLFSLIVGLFSLFSYYSEKGVRLFRRFAGHRKLLLVCSLLVPLLVFTYSISLALNPPKVERDKLASGKKISKNAVPSLERLATNPINTILLTPFQTRKQETFFDQRVDKVTLDNFKFGLNTDSFVSRRHFPRINIPKGKKYNVIFYFFESTAYKYLDMTLKGRHVAPNWKKMSRNSFFATKHYAHFPLSAKALFSVLCSAYDHYGKFCVPMHYPEIKLKTVPEWLKQHGYRTAVIQSSSLNIYGHRDFLKDRKLDKIIELRDLVEAGNPRVTPMSVDDRAMLKPAIRFMKNARKRNKPFFVTMFPFLPHHPYLVHDKTKRLLSHQEILREKSLKRRSWLRYLNSLHFADAVLGQFVEALRKEGLLKNTLIFLFADHGEAFYQHRRNYLHSFFVYEENVRLPFMIYNPDLFPQQVRYEGISRHVDLYPTLLDILGLDKPNHLEGISLISPHKQQSAYFHTHWYKDIVGMRDGKWKFIRHNCNGYEELFDLEQDPDERNNLVDQYPELAKTFRTYVASVRQYKRVYFKKIDKGRFQNWKDRLEEMKKDRRWFQGTPGSKDGGAGGGIIEDPNQSKPGKNAPLIDEDKDKNFNIKDKYREE